MDVERRRGDEEGKQKEGSGLSSPWACLSPFLSFLYHFRVLKRPSQKSLPSSLLSKGGELLGDSC
jgi:hypothetical protein